MRGYGAAVGADEREIYESKPVFNEELFEACMNAAGWEFGTPALEQKPPVSDTPLGQGTATPVDPSGGPLRPPEI